MAHIILGYCIYFSTSFVNLKWENCFFWVLMLSFCSQKYGLLWSTWCLTLKCAVSLHCSMSGTLSQLQDDFIFLQKNFTCSKLNTVYGLCWDLTDTYNMYINTNSLGRGQNPKHDMWWNVHTVCQVHFSYHTTLLYSMNDTYTFFNSSMK